MLTNTTGQALLGDKQLKNTQPRSEIISDQIQSPSSNPSLIKKSEIKKNKTKKQKQFTFVLKMFNLLLGLFLTAFGAYCYYSINQLGVKNFELIGYIMPGYIALSGLVIIAIELHIKFICRNMKFLYNYFGRGFFNIYVGIMPLTLLDNSEGSNQDELEQVFIYILVCLLIFVGLLYIISKIFCCAKEGESRKKKRRSNDSEDSSSD